MNIKDRKTEETYVLEIGENGKSITVTLRFLNGEYVYDSAGLPYAMARLDREEWKQISEIYQKIVEIEKRLKHGDFLDVGTGEDNCGTGGTLVTEEWN